MRIIRGKFKGRKIAAPKNLPVRPTTDFAKEALFNIIENSFELEKLKVLDLFAGTGNISLEFISRGVESCFAVEQNSACIRFIHSLNKQLEIKNLQVRRGNVFTVVKQINQSFDLVFADPPYQLENLETLPDLILNKSKLLTTGTLILEHGSNWTFEDHPHFQYNKRYGNVNFTFFSKST